ncbi:hypothetical protein C8Q80DRAFT_1188375 [Daedaleopsis nitida]|nr:hypothetical protein C8Q80DRAFT_1188375 [Daedaleopsis nitida]
MTTLSPTGAFFYDLLMHILDFLRDDYLSLYRCSLVDRTFRDSASTYLYRSVTYSPEFSPVLDLKKRNEFVEGFFASSRLSHNASLVRRVTISGFLSPRPPPLNKLSDQLKAAIESWPNIQTLVLAPKQYHESIFTEILPMLLNFPVLRDLTVNASCTNEDQAPILAQLRDLESLTIVSPSRAILQRLPEWLVELRPTLRKLHLTNSCGSVTPGVLRSFLQPLQNTTSFALGLSYSLTDDDVFQFWTDLPNLEDLEFRYYLQLRPSITPRLIRLRHFTVHYIPVMTRIDAAHMYKWVRRVISHAPLECLRLIPEFVTQGGAAVTFDPLLEHLAARHAQNLRVLDMKECFVGRTALIMLCKTCTNLEELNVAVSLETMRAFAEYSKDIRRLHTVELQVRNLKRTVLDQLDILEVAETMIQSTSSIRRVRINGTQFEVCDYFNFFLASDLSLGMICRGLTSLELTGSSGSLSRT